MSSRSRVSSFMCMAFLFSTVKYQGTHGRCSCVFSLQGKTFNITSLQSADDTASLTVEHDGYMFSYNPCRSFHFDPTPPTGDCQDDMAMCYWVSDIMYHKIADQSTAKCSFNEKYNLPMLQYTGDSFIKKTTVLLKCDNSIKKPKFRVVDASKDAEFVFEVTHECACPDTCVISPSVHTTKDPAGTTVPGELHDRTGVIKIVGWIFGSLGFLFIVTIVSIVIKRRAMRGRQNDEQQQPILGGVVDETRNNLEASASGGSEVASGSDSVRPSLSKKDDINRTLKNMSKTV